MLQLRRRMHDGLHELGHLGKQALHLLAQG